MIKVLYAGSPEESGVTLEGLILRSGTDFEIAGVLTNPASAKKRSSALIPTPVGLVAEKYKIPLFTPEHLDSEVRNEIQKINADILVCFAYGHIFGPKFLELFKYGGINLHPSALPKYRGCTPVNAAILNRDLQTAFTIQKVSLKMDEGNIISQKKIDLDFSETAGSLLLHAAKEGITLFSDILKELNKNSLLPEGIVQSGDASYTKIILKSDAKINWNDSAEKIDAFVRAYFPEPCAWTLENDQKIQIFEGEAVTDSDAETFSCDLKSLPGTVCAFVKQKGILIKCGIGFYAVKKLQRQGKNAMDYKSFMNGARNFIGTVLN